MTIDLAIPPAVEAFRYAISTACKEWFGSAVIKGAELSEGMSGACVLRVDISQVTTGSLDPGQYVLKAQIVEVGAPVDRIRVAHEKAANSAPEFARQHMPELIAEHVVTQNDRAVEVALLSIAGGSLRRYISCARADSPMLVKAAKQIVFDLAFNWTLNNETSAQGIENTVRSLMGESRFDDAIEISRQLSSGQAFRFTESGVLVWPHRFFEIVGAHSDEEERTVVLGVNHRDLHGGNILVDPSNVSDYFIIDFDESESGPAGYDAAYLEVQKFYRICDGITPGAAIRALRANPAPEDEESLPTNASAFVQLHQQIRFGQDAAWKANAWQDALRRQAELARIAAALIWLRRASLSQTERDTVHLYAAAKCDEFLRTFHPSWIEEVAPTTVTEADEEPLSEAAKAAWPEIMSQLGKLDGSSRRFILVAERGEFVAESASLGLAPWSAVIDLDPRSTEDGLFSLVAPNLESVRGVHRFSTKLPMSLSPRGCAWMFANGWRDVGDVVLDDRDWVYQTIPRIRRLGRELRARAGDFPTTVLVVSGSNASPSSRSSGPIDRLKKVIEALDEAFEGNINFVCCGQDIAPAFADAVEYPIRTAELSKLLAAELGTTMLHGNLEVPGESGPVQILPSTAATMAESFEILHRRSPLMSDGESIDGDFIRGGQPTWSDFQDSSDVPRDVYRKAMKAILGELDERRTRTVILYHNPGAGGTTLARRIAWDLHTIHPVCVLRSDQFVGPVQVSILAERLRLLYELAGRPVFCVADNSTLSESAREQLYRSLASSGTRVVLLYLRRKFASNAETADEAGVLELLDPMSETEARRFAEVYRRATNDSSRQAEILKLTRPEYSRYRTPFFFGLAAFDRDFRSIETYVSNHIAGVLRRRRDVLEYVAFVTIFCETGIELGTVQKLLGVTTKNGLLDLADLFGESVARLLVAVNGRVKLVHPIIADEVLKELVGGGQVDWRLHAHEIADELVRDLATMADPQSSSTMDLLRQLFVERPGTRFDEIEDRRAFAPLIELLDGFDAVIGHKVLRTLTDYFPEDAHFWTHLGRHQIYRVGRDFDNAIGFVQRAVGLSPEDPIHHHVLGQVHRYMMKQIIRQNRRVVSATLLELISQPHDDATSAFTESRSLAPENIHGYVTHMQTTIEATKALSSAANVTAVADMGDTGLQQWVLQRLSVVSELADAAAILYRTLDDTDDYLRRCLADLTKLYGDLDHAIEIWEAVADTSGATPYGRRSLAYTYLTRANRKWSGLTVAELARIVELMALNTRAPRPTDEDFRLWFEAYRLSPDFDMDDALANLSLWSERAQGWRPSFYASTLNFVLWWAGRASDLTEFQSSLETTKSLAIGRSRNSLLWFATGPEACPLLGADELGTWDRTKNFWGDAQGLKRVNGTIDGVIRGPQAGEIVVDGSLRVFFVPAAGGFSKNGDEGRDVNFFLGFSPEGPKAWDVTRGHMPGGYRHHLGSKNQLVWTQREVDPAKSKRQENPRLVDNFVLQLVQSRSEVGLDSPRETVEQRMRTVFGDTSVRSGVMEQAVSRNSSLSWSDDSETSLTWADPSVIPTNAVENQELGEVVEVNKDKSFVVIRNKRRSEKVVAPPKLLSKSPPFIVQFARTPSGTIRTSTLIDLPTQFVVFEGALVSEADMPHVVGAFCLAELEKRPNHSATVSDLYSKVSERFGGPGILHKSLGFKSAVAFLKTVVAISIIDNFVHKAGSGFNPLGAGVLAPPESQSAGSLTITRKAAPTDVSPGASKKSTQPAAATSAKNQSSRAMTAIDIQVSKGLRAHAMDLEQHTFLLSQIGTVVRDAIGAAAYRKWIGKHSLAKKMQGIEGVVVRFELNGRDEIDIF